MIFLWIYAAGKTIWFIIFPDPRSTVFHNLMQYSLIIELFFVVMVLSLIPIFISLRRHTKENDKKISIDTILLLSLIAPILAFVNNYFTGNILFSIFLLTYGILFTIIAYKFRI